MGSLVARDSPVPRSVLFPFYQAVDSFGDRSWMGDVSAGQLMESWPERCYQRGIINILCEAERGVDAGRRE